MTIYPVTTSRCALVIWLVFAVAVRQGISGVVEGDVRLVGASYTTSKGRVEVFHEGAWLSVCVASWDTREGDVICRQLGFSGGAMSTDRSALYGEGTSSSWLTEASCTGNEDRFSDCVDLIGTDTCSHANDAGVRCTYPMYQGCYSVSAIAPLTSFSTQSNSMTIASCIQTCLQRGPFMYAGVWAGMKCSCGVSISSAFKQRNLACNTPCPGDSSEICGGSSTASIYNTINIYDGAEGGYTTSPQFPNPYGIGDSFTGHSIGGHLVTIPDSFNYAVVTFLYFQLAPGDSVALTALGSPSMHYNGSSSTAVPEYWMSTPGADSFLESFTVADGSPGNMGFALKYEFGRLCAHNALPVSIPDGTYPDGRPMYSYNEEVSVTCSDGYQADRNSFVCLLDGSWSPAPICSPIPTTLAPLPTTVESTTTQGYTQTTAGAETTQPWTQGGTSAALTTTPRSAICRVPAYSGGTVMPRDTPTVLEGQTISLTCNDSYTLSGGNSQATCQPSGEFDEALSCTPNSGLPAWLISIIVVAGVLAFIVVVLIFLLVAVNNENKPPPRYRGPLRDEGDLPRDGPMEARLVPIAPSVHQGGMSTTQSVASLDMEENGMVNQGAQTEADPSLGDLGDPMLNENDVNHPTRDYPGAGGGAAVGGAAVGGAAVSGAAVGGAAAVSSAAAGFTTTPGVSPSGNGSTTPSSHAGHPPRFFSVQSPPISPPHTSPFYRASTADFSMLANEELLAVRALDNVVSDFERVDQGFFLGPSGPSPYSMDRGSRFGSRQIQYPQHSRSSFYALY